MEDELKNNNKKKKSSNEQRRQSDNDTIEENGEEYQYRTGREQDRQTRHKKETKIQTILPHEHTDR
jgi:hypothetical protein